MRFDRLLIPAFGPFTNLDMKFSQDKSDLHIIYGSNEAGKSSLLRAFRDLLFGIHGHSSDNFLHDYKEMRIIGEVINSLGERLTFQRRKGNKNTLLNEAGDPLPENSLLKFLGSVDQRYFSTMFGLGTQELREGAEELLRGEGNIGNALFSASLGGTPVQVVLKSLIQEAESLFKGRTIANVTIRPQSNRYKELLKLSREVAVNPELWESIEKDIASAKSDKAKLENEILELTRDLEWLNRCEDAFPTVGRLEEEVRRLEQLPLLPDVSNSFVERARGAKKSVSDAQSELNRLTNHIEKLKNQLASCKTSPLIMAESDTIERLHQNMRLYGKKSSLIELETEIAEIEAVLQSAIDNIGFNGSICELEQLRLSSTDRLSFEESANSLQKALEEHDKNRDKIEDTQRQIQAKENKLKNSPKNDLTSLRDALSTAAGATDANKTLAGDQFEVERLKLEIDNLHKELKDAPNDLNKTGNLPVPAKSTIHRISEEMAEIKRLIKIEENKIADGKRRIESIHAELGRIDRRGVLPSQEALCKAREDRDYGWKLVLADWKGYTDISQKDNHGEYIYKSEFIQNLPLEETFPQLVAQADYIADKLLENAEVVAQVEEKRFQIAKSEQQNRDAQEAINRLQTKLKEVQSSWESIWLECEITPLSPVEMDEWREKWSQFKNLLRQLRTSESSLARKVNQIEQAKKELSTVLGLSQDNQFELLFEKARQLVQHGEELRGRREGILEELSTLKSQLETFMQDSLRIDRNRESAQKMWIRQCAKIGLPEDISPASGLAILKERVEILGIFDRWKKLIAKYEKVASKFQQYEQEVNILYNAIKNQNDGFGRVEILSEVEDRTENKISRLWNALSSAKEAQVRYNQLIEQIEESNNELVDAKIASIQATRTLEELISLGKLDTTEELESLIANLELKNKIQNQINIFRDTLSALARSQIVDQFITLIKAEDSETISARKNNLNRLKQEKAEELQNINDALYSLKERKRRLENSGDAASNYRQQAESCAALLKQDSQRFIQLRLAIYFLQTQIERFRKENQGPLLERSGQIFKNITLEAFSGLGAKFNADDTPILVGLRPEQSEVPIEGMSDGTRDQLYLALRIAALYSYLEQHEPMPLILDDLLITFDDERVGATLPELASLAKRTQTFLFTHHEHLIELCYATLGRDKFSLHRLTPTRG